MWHCGLHRCLTAIRSWVQSWALPSGLRWGISPAFLCGVCMFLHNVAQYKKGTLGQVPGSLISIQHSCVSADLRNELQERRLQELPFLLPPSLCPNSLLNWWPDQDIYALPPPRLTRVSHSQLPRVVTPPFHNRLACSWPFANGHHGSLVVLIRLIQHSQEFLH